MQKVNIRTSQNVAIQYTLAQVGERALANMIDYIVIMVYFMACYFLVWIIEIDFSMALNTVISIPALLYQLICETTMQGQSIGMKQRKIKVISLSGEEVSIGSYIIRWLLRPVDILMTGGALAVLSIIVTDKGQRIGDIAANTTVVRVDEEALLDNTSFAKIKEGYILQFPQVYKLNSRDIEIIKETLLMYSKIKKRQPVDMLSKKIIDLLNVETQLHPLKFLEVIVQDYNYLNGNV